MADIQLTMLPLVACLLVLCAPASPARILGLFPHHARSHFMMSEAVMRALAARGHQVTVVSHFPQPTPLRNYTDISLDGSMTKVVSALPLDGLGTGSVIPTLLMGHEWAITSCEKTLSFPPVRELIASDRQFDLVIAELFNSECYLAFAHKFRAPLVQLSSSVPMPWAHSRVANPDNPAYIPNHFMAHSDRMSFVERMINAGAAFFTKVGYELLVFRSSQSIAEKHFGELPSLRDIAYNVSLVLVNTHFSVNRPRPLMPAMVEVGGLHIGAPRPLPKTIEKFLDEASEGAIYFSLGSMVRASTFPKDKLRAFQEAFAELPQRVLWKWEEDMMDQPRNVLIAPWLPQRDVLAHPNVKLFLTHGGLMGTMEAIHEGVPMVTMPLFGDQPMNVRCYVDAGVAELLHLPTVMKEDVLRALRTVLNDDGYAQRSKQMSIAFRDRPKPPLDTAVWWIEHVIRHKGAPHLRSAAMELSWYSYYLLDVLAVVMGIIFFVGWIVFRLVRSIVTLFRQVPSKGVKSSAKNLSKTKKNTKKD